MFEIVQKYEIFPNIPEITISSESNMLETWKLC